MATSKVKLADPEDRSSNSYRTQAGFLAGAGPSRHCVHLGGPDRPLPGRFSDQGWPQATIVVMLKGAGVRMSNREC